MDERYDSIYTGEEIDAAVAFTQNFPSWINAEEGAILKIVNGYPTWVKVITDEGVEF